MVDLSRCLGAWSLWRGDLPLLLISSPSTSGILLDDRDSDEEEEEDGDLVIEVADFSSNVSGLYFDGFGIHHLSNVESDAIVELLKWVL